MTNDDLESRRMRLDVSLAEYNRAWAEIAARFTNQLAAFTIFAGGIAGVFAFGKLTEDLPLLCLVAPVFIAPLSYIFFDNELHIWRVAAYTRVTLRGRIVTLTGDDNVLGLDSATFTTNAAKTTITLLSFGRWMIFLFPACTAVVIAYPTAMASPILRGVLALDVGLVIVLCFGIGAALAEQLEWRRETAAQRRSTS